MTTAVTKGTLRLGEVGPEISGPPGSVLTFGPDGRTLTGQAAGGAPLLTGPLVPAVIELSEASPGPSSAVVTLATLAQAGARTGVQVNGWADLNMSVDETGSPSASDGAILVEISWDGGSTFEAGIAKPWRGGGPQNPTDLLVPLFASSSAGPATGDVQCRITFSGEPVGGAEALTITLTSELGAVLA